MCKQC